MFGNLGFWEIAVIAGLALLFFGPKGIPEMGRHIGQFWRFVQKGQHELKQAIELDPELQEASRHDPRATHRPVAPPHAVSRGGDEQRETAGSDSTARPPAEADEEIPQALLGTAPEPAAPELGEAVSEAPGAEASGHEEPEPEATEAGEPRPTAGTPS